MQPDVFSITYKKGIEELNEILRDSRDNFSLFRVSIEKPFLLEAWKRSGNFRKTRIKERSLYFLCLISSNKNIKESKEISGFQPGNTNCFIIYDKKIGKLLSEIDGVILEPYDKTTEADKNLYFQLTLTEMEMIA